jgi:hypothetical protein
MTRNWLQAVREMSRLGMFDVYRNLYFGCREMCWINGSARRDTSDDLVDSILGYRQVCYSERTLLFRDDFFRFHDLHVFHLII